MLYTSTNGQYWIDSTNWLNDTVDPCGPYGFGTGGWYGVGDCDSGAVTELWLTSNNLTGSLP